GGHRGAVPDVCRRLGRAAARGGGGPPPPDRRTGRTSMSRRHRRGWNGRMGKPRRKRPPQEPPPVPSRVEQMTARQREEDVRMREMIAAVKEREERQAQRDYELVQALAHEPMVPGSVVWHQH